MSERYALQPVTGSLMSYGRRVLTMTGVSVDGGDDNEIRQLIVTALNAHDDLVAALRTAIEIVGAKVEGRTEITALRGLEAALAKATAP